MLFTSRWFPTRIPVSLVLLPILWLVLAISPNLNQWRSLWVLIIVYGLLFGAINGFSNYFTKPEKAKAIGKHYLLFSTSVLLYLLAVTLSFVLVSKLFSLLIAVYGIIAFTHGYWQKYDVINRVLLGLVQGFFTFFLLYIGINKFSLNIIQQANILIPGTLISTVLWAFHPIIHRSEIKLQPTYQRTIVKVGQHKLFLLSVGLFSLAIVLAGGYFSEYIAWSYFPPLLGFYVTGILLLYIKFLPQEIRYANFLSWISIISLNAFFFYVFTDYTNIFQLL